MEIPGLRSFTEALGYLLQRVSSWIIPICPPNVSPVLPTTLTPPSFPTQAYLWLFLNSILKGCQTALLTQPILFPNVLCAQGLCCLLLSLSRIKARARGWAELQSQGHSLFCLTAILPFISSSAPRASMCAPTFLAGNKQNHELHCTILIS